MNRRTFFAALGLAPLLKWLAESNPMLKYMRPPHTIDWPGLKIIKIQQYKGLLTDTQILAKMDEMRGTIRTEGPGLNLIERGSSIPIDPNSPGYEIRTGPSYEDNRPLNPGELENRILNSPVKNIRSFTVEGAEPIFKRNPTSPQPAGTTISKAAYIADPLEIVVLAKNLSRWRG